MIINLKTEFDFNAYVTCEENVPLPKPKKIPTFLVPLLRTTISASLSLSKSSIATEHGTELVPVKYRVKLLNVQSPTPKYIPIWSLDASATTKSKMLLLFSSPIAIETT